MSTIPSNWSTTVLSDIAFIEMGQSPDSRFYNDLGNGLPFFQGKAEFGKLYPNVKKWCSEPTKIAYTGDILLSVRAPVGPTNVAYEKSCIGRGLAAIRTFDGIEQKYLLFFFKNIEPWLMEQGTGTTFTAISGAYIRNLEFPIAPLNEQKRIADKLDTLLARVDACREHLERVPGILKRFRQAVLSAAVSGRLTEEWRKKNEINNHWEQKTIGEVTENAKQYKPKSDEEFYYIDIASIDKDQKKIINPKEFLGKDAPSRARQVVETGDILVSMTRPNLNSVALVTPEFNNQIASTGFDVLRPINIEPEWLFLLVRTDKFIAKMSELVQGALYPAIRPKDIRNFSIPSPSLNEQKEIIRWVEALFAFADRLEQRYQTARKLVEGLTPALLAKAFRGELVPQDPNDEPASVLLERIRGENAKP